MIRIDRRTPRSTWLLPVVGFLFGCGGSGDGPSAVTPPTMRQVTFDFAQGNGGWIGGYSDYGTQTAPIDVVTEPRLLPAPFTGSGYYFAGTNRSDDLFIFSTYKISGLGADVRYRAAYEVDFLSDVPRDCVGVGGSPGESVWIVVAASTAEPRVAFNGRDYRLNIDRGNQGASGTQGVVLGNIANSVPDCGPRRFETKKLATPAPSPLSVTADSRGEAWILIGMDSGFESLSRIYLQRVQVAFTPAG